MTDLTHTERFRLVFEQLTSACNQNPQTLVTFFKERPQFVELAWKVDRAARDIKKSEAASKMMAQISPKFIKAWKAYLYQWRVPIGYVILSSVAMNSPDLLGPAPEFDEYAGQQRQRQDRSAPDPLDDCAATTTMAG